MWLVLSAFPIWRRETGAESLPTAQVFGVGGNYRISRPIRRTAIFFLLGILEKYNDDCILILVIYWKKTGLLHTKINNHNVIYSS